MADANVQVNLADREDIQSYWFSGSDLLEVGQFLCFDIAASEGALKTSLGRQVVQPATANLMLPAGVVDARVQGPNVVRLRKIDRNFVGDVFTDANMVAGATILGPQNGSYALAIVLDDHNGTPAARTGHNLLSVAVALVTENTDSTNANSLLKGI